MKIKIKLPLVFLSYFFVMIALFYILSTRLVTDGIEETANSGFDAASNTFAMLLDNWLYEQGMTISYTINYNDKFDNFLIDPSEENRKEARDFLVDIKKNDPLIYTTVVTDRNGNVVLNAGDGHSDPNANWKDHCAWNNKQ